MLRHRTLPLSAARGISNYRVSIGRWVLGAFVLCASVILLDAIDLGFSISAFVLLTAVTILSMDSFISAVILSVFAASCLHYSFSGFSTEPTAEGVSILTLAAFIISSLGLSASRTLVQCQAVVKGEGQLVKGHVESERDYSQAACLAEAQKLSQTGSFGWDLTGGRVYWSEETYRILGISASATPSLKLVLDRTHPDDLDEVRELFRRASLDRLDFNHEFRISLPEGTARHVRVVARCVPGVGDSFHYVGALMDISAQKQAFAGLEKSEQRYRHLFDRMPIALWQLNASRLVELFRDLRRSGVVDLDSYFDAHPQFLKSCMEALIFEEANDRAVSMFGGKQVCELVGKPVVDTWAASEATFRRAMVSCYLGKRKFEEETKMVTLDNRIVDVLFTTARVGGAGDPETSLMGVIDISERTEALERLQQVQAEFAQVARLSALGELTASIAHEINQPLAAISTAGAVGLRWINRPEPDLDEVRESLDSMVADAQRASEIIARIRATAVGNEPERIYLSLDEVVNEALQFLRNEIQTRSAAILHQPSPDSPKILGDRTQLHQVFVNLAMNALQAVPMSGEGVPKIVIRTRIVDGHVLCTIEDNGAGIEVSNLDHLFQSFFTTKKNGMGLGLPICKSIVEGHGGTIMAESKSQTGGASFSIRIPIAHPAEGNSMPNQTAI